MTNANSQQIQSFNNNPLIQRLSTISQWSISDNDKKPLNIQTALDTNFRHPKLFNYHRPGNLLPLTQFDNQVPEIIHNRALRLNTKALHVFAIDIEPQYNHDRWDKWLKWIPIDYIEYSMHDGYHVLVNIPDPVYNNPETQKFLNSNSDIQFLEEGKSHQGIEFVFNKHFMTLTRRIITDKSKYPYTPYEPKNDKQKDKWISKFLMVIQKMNEHNHASLSINQDVLGKINNQTRQQANIIKTYITNDQIEHAKQTAIKNATRNTGELDLSRVEWRFLSSIYGYYHLIQKNNAYITSVEQQLKIANSKQLIELLNNEAVTATVITIIGKEQLKPREKWNTKRQGIPWLLSNSLKIIKYFKAQDQK